MSSLRYKVGKAGLVLAHLIFRLTLYACLAVVFYWVGKQAYTFGYQVFNQQAMNPGEGVVVTVAVPSGAGDYEVAKILEERGLISNARVFFVQEYLSGYHGRLAGGGTYALSTAYTPMRLMSILAGEEEEEEDD